MIDQKIHGQIAQGMLLLLGIEEHDGPEDATWLVNKIASMRIFSDEKGLMNRSIKEIKGSILLISQFTLHAQTKKGNRPSFIKAARPEQAIPLYEYFQELIHQQQIPLQTGIFGAYMKVHLINDGPVTIIMDSKTRE